MPSAGHPPAVDGTPTSSDSADAALVITPLARASIQRLGTTAHSSPERLRAPLPTPCR